MLTKQQDEEHRDCENLRSNLKIAWGHRERWVSEHEQAWRSIQALRNRRLVIDRELHDLTKLSNFASVALNSLIEAAARVLAGRRRVASGTIEAISAANTAAHQTEESRTFDRIRALVRERDQGEVEEGRLLRASEGLRRQIDDHDRWRAEKMRDFQAMNCEHWTLTRTY